jgi:hypothetical protein
MTVSRWQELLLPIIIAALTTVATIGSLSFMLQSPSVNSIGVIETYARSVR